MIALVTEQQLQRATDGSALVWSILVALAVVWIGGGLVSGYGAWRRSRR